jgi:hypothetical protein
VARSMSYHLNTTTSEEAVAVGNQTLVLLLSPELHLAPWSFEMMTGAVFAEN